MVIVENTPKPYSNYSDEVDKVLHQELPRALARKLPIGFVVRGWQHEL